MNAQETTDTPRVWIGSLSAYNAGKLIGQWVDADDLEAMEAVAAKLPGEEFALMDREGFGDLIGEYTPLETVAKLAELLAEHGEAFRLFCDNEGLSESDAVDAVGSFEESYRGDWSSSWNPGRDYAEQTAEELGCLPDGRQWPLNHIDWDAAWRELSMDGYWEQDGHIFGPY